MRFCVSVPVLSLQMTLAAPSVSTAVRWRTSAFFFAMRWVAMASDKVTVGSKPSGTLATMMPMAKIRFAQNDKPINCPMRKNSCAEQDGEQRHQPRQARDLFLQRRQRFLYDLRQARDVAEFGMHAGGVHHGFRLARDQRGAGMQDVAPQCDLLFVWSRWYRATWAAIRR